MKKKSLLLFVFSLAFFNSVCVNGQVILYENKFNASADSIGSPSLPAGWVNSASDSAWSFDNQKPNKLDSTSLRDMYNFMCNNKVIRLNKDVSVTNTIGVPTKNYKNIKMIWSERISPKFLLYSSLHVDFSLDSGKTWDSLPHKFDLSGTSTWMQTNGGSPVSFPARADNADKIWIRWVAKSTLPSGNYQFDDIKITGEIITEIGEVNNNLQNVIGFPNPVSDELNILFSVSISNQSAELYDVTGRLISSMVFAPDSASAVFDMKRFPEGIYYLRLKSADHYFVEKIIKK